MKTILDLYAPCFHLGKWLGIIPALFQIYPMSRNIEEDRQWTLKRLFLQIFFISRAAAIAYSVAHFLFIVVRAFICFYKAIHGQPNSILEAISWVLVSCGAWVTAFLFHTHKGSLKTIYDDIHDLGRSLTERKFCITMG